MDELWQAVVSDSVRPGLPAFFPERAYLQVKTLGDPAYDWRIRLLLDYRLDIGGAHRFVGSDATSAQLVGVRVPEAYAHWVDPGACYNRVGYWEVPNARVVFREGRHVRSFGIASMISWRGVWYVIHLGATFRVGNIPVLDDPADGPGTSAPSSSC